MRIYQVIILLVVCSALAFAAGVKIGEGRAQPAPLAAADAESVSCECEIPEGWAEVLAAREEDAPQIPPTPGKPSVVGFIGEDSEDSGRVQTLLNEIAPQISGEAGVAVVEADVHRDLALEWHLRMVPTVVFLDAEGEEVARHEGILSSEEVLAQLRAAGAEVE